MSSRRRLTSLPCARFREWTRLWSSTSWLPKPDPSACPTLCLTAGRKLETALWRHPVKWCKEEVNTPSGASPASADGGPSTLLLDFGDDIIIRQSVSRRLLLVNQTAIAAPFTFQPEYFRCYNIKPHGLDQRYLAFTCPLLTSTG